MVKLQLFESSLESRSALIKEWISKHEEDLRKLAESRESMETMRSPRNSLIEEAVQQELSARAVALTEARDSLATHDRTVKAEVAKLVGAEKKQ
jgi:hypothetical protein